jgi:hypothetical protein
MNHCMLIIKIYLCMYLLKNIIIKNIIQIYLIILLIIEKKLPPLSIGSEEIY